MEVFARVLVAVATLAALCALGADGRPDTKTYPRTCEERGACCPGQNNTCYAYGPRMDQSDDSDRCYCDANCLIMGDCCTDYAHICKAQNCAVGEWGDWSNCTNMCGYGKRLRYRPVDKYPENGGRHCPALKQRRACVGHDSDYCMQLNVEFQEQELNERANILPKEFAQYRSMKKFQPWKGILKNLYDRYFNEIFTRPAYCGRYMVTKASKHCLGQDWAADLKVNETVCVECQPVAMHRDIGMRCTGHGVARFSTEWKAVDVHHCKGEWTMVQGHGPCTCNAETEKSFIFI